VIAPFWADLVLRDSPGSDLCYQSTGTMPNRKLIIEWLDAYVYSHTSVHLTFEVVLSETTNTIDLIYSRLEPATGLDADRANGSLASVGVQSSSTEYLRHTGAVSTTAGVRLSPR
jgi:hypothetical protein